MSAGVTALAEWNFAQIDSFDITVKLCGVCGPLLTRQQITHAAHNLQVLNMLRHMRHLH